MEADRKPTTEVSETNVRQAHEEIIFALVKLDEIGQTLHPNRETSPYYGHATDYRRIAFAVWRKMENTPVHATVDDLQRSYDEFGKWLSSQPHAE